MAKYIASDEYTYIAKHKETNKEFNDFNNASGALIRYLKEVSPELEVPSKWLRNSYYQKTGDYWYEQYFNIIKVPIVVKKKRGELYDEEIVEIIRLYKSGELRSTHKLGEKFKVGHKKISNILKENDVEITARGGQRKYPSDKLPVKYENGDGYVYKAIHKETGKTFDDFTNSSGALTRYLMELNPDIKIPTLQSEIKTYFLENQSYWYEEYYDITKFTHEEADLKTCPYCEEGVRLGVYSIKYKNHLSKEHNITTDEEIEEHVSKYPDDIEMFQNELERMSLLKDNDNWVVCKICGEKMGNVNHSHLMSKHNITLTEYKKRFGTDDIISVSYSNFLSENMKQNNASGIMFSPVSKPELEIQKLLDEWGIKHENNRQILIGKEIDILCPDYKIGIEFNGNKWHTEFFGKKDRYYHLEKTIKCNEKGYGLIHIFEDEWETNKELITRKLKHIFNKNTELPKIGARKCKIHEIRTRECGVFLDKYHIQGRGQATVSLGAFYDDELVGVMLFKIRSKEGQEYELARFATNYNYIYQGLGSRMLSYFIKNYNPSEIISFADRRWTLDKDNNLYTMLGFELDNILKPDYRYYNEKVDRYKREHKFGFRKQTLNRKYGLDLSMTETEMIKELGYDRIWDCGLFRYKLTLKRGSCCSDT